VADTSNGYGRCVWVIDLVCSDDECAQEIELLVADLDEADRIACECGCALVTLSVAEAIELRLGDR
jgi:hypothetical protein